MTSLDSALKSRDITQPTKVQIDKATVFLGHIESWTIKDALELTSSNCGAGEYSWESLEQQGDQTSQS